ncbi:MAG TPA: aminoglycoside phosphotransferase family protein, partial [Ktedonobacterales bacterium]
FIEGETGWRPSLTDAQWKALGMILRKIHQASLPPGSIPSLRQETFDTAAYSRQIREFDAHFDRHPANADSGNQVELTLCVRWMEHQPTIHTLLAAMETLAAVLRRRSEPHVICHADLHPGNIIRDYTGHVHLIDWDDVMLAPKERDFLFVADPPEESAAGDGAPPFFQGYGPAEIDWVALTYYRCERVVQDLLECAQEVVFRDDLGEEAKADAVQLFGEVLAPGGMVEAAWAAAAHLPSDLGFPSRAGT